jgi:hypothetical protein
MFREELIAYSPLMQQGPYRKRKNWRGGGAHRQQGDLIKLLAEFREDTQTGRQTAR